MQNRLFFFGFISLIALALLGAGCNSTSETTQPVVNEPVQEQPVNEEIPQEESIVDESSLENSSTVDIQETPTSTAPVEEEPAPAPSESEDTQEETIDQSPTPVIESPVEEQEEVAPIPTVRIFDVTLKQWEFIPSVITVNEGDTVRLNVTSTDVDHGISILTFGVSVRVPAGETKVVEFVADKQGTFSMVCNVFCGSGHGSMKGSLIVN